MMGYESRTDLAFTRTLDHEHSPRLKYRRRKGEVKSVVHWGQRKLCLSEVCAARDADGTRAP